MQRQTTFGGGVSPRNTRLRGQSIIEYVLIIAIIGLVIVFAGPQVSGAIRNQLEQVTNTVDAGTSGDGFISAEEKAHQEAMKNIAAKGCRNWSLDELKEVATDISKNGTSSVVYAEARNAMDGKVTWSVQLNNGKTMSCRIIGIAHDDLADGSGKAGLTFIGTTNGIKSRYNPSTVTEYNWKNSEIRAKMNSGEIWSLMPSDIQSKVKSVKKLTNNTDGKNSDAVVTMTTDKLFLLSYSEVEKAPYSGWSNCSWITNEGSQYERFQNGGPGNVMGASSTLLRTLRPNYSKQPLLIFNGNHPSDSYVAPDSEREICPAFCF